MGLQFSNTTTRLGIIQDCERYTGLGNTAISGNAILLDDFTAYINSEMRKTWHTIFTSTGNWKYDDANQTDLPQATTDLVASQAIYVLPTTALTVNRVEVKHQGDFYKLTPILEENIPIGIDEFRDGDGLPTYYRLVGNTLEVFPASDTTTAAGIKVYFDRGSVAFEDTDTTKAPGFASEYHDIVPIGASLRWMKTYKPKDDSIPYLREDYEKLTQNLGEFYKRQFKDKRVVMKRKKTSFR